MARPTVAYKCESEIMDDLVLSFEKKGIISKTNHCDGEFISTVFTVPKSNGSFRLILKILMNLLCTNISKWNIYNLF